MEEKPLKNYAEGIAEMMQKLSVIKNHKSNKKG